MPEVRFRQTNSSPEVEYAEICIPDDRDLGTGRFKIIIKRSALLNNKQISSLIIRPPVFQISVNLDVSKKEISVFLGLADGSLPVSRAQFFFPEKVDFLSIQELEVFFENWDIKMLLMDGKELDVTKGLQLPDEPLPEHEGSVVLSIPGPDLPESLQHKILDDLFNLTNNFTLFQTKQGNTEINIYRNSDFRFVYQHYNPTFGEREAVIDFADVKRQGLRAFYICATWTASKNCFYVGLIHEDTKLEGLRQNFVLSQDKLRLIKENIEALEELLRTAKKEEEAHQFLKNNELILGLTSANEPISKFRLGSDYVTDFVIKEIPDGHILVEIERPSLKLFRRNSLDRTQDFNHAIQQIESWRDWVARNHFYVCQKLDGISPMPLCWLIAGRRHDLSEEERNRLAQINAEYRGTFKVFTYDDLIDRVKNVIRNMS